MKRDCVRRISRSAFANQETPKQFRCRANSDVLRLGFATAARRSGNEARLCPQDQPQRLRKSGNPEIIPTSGKFGRAAAGLCHSRAPDNPKGIASSSPRLPRTLSGQPWVNLRK